ncbi:CoA transferase [Rhodococcus sp. 06-156-3C]|uniref:CaiB/BaiF CoA transferase family protein n=1 Tax=Nocardiaceae TaxID=85025 RepID=UPI000522FE5A|nr:MULTISPECIES: CoA transferase [Rhodococcus]OZD13102.1 CoA transferase [Rhodococcus sp. 06-156-4a]OZD17971.1 CoA transferase [Rhodococcus sp. 06-156-3C]OZD20695.1 CoA transferase [Rhodococcus sp. 06-156-4C]OZD30586.1 CoA transferase [Rhodococcus sp. 06-156-3b]OZD32641.1 CoA transferase [Rhodococcus sp. 06-156-3]
MSALSGVKVICVGQFYFAPYCSMLLARLGADVVKVESPSGDPYRKLPSTYDDGVSIQFSMINSGKRSLKLDLSVPDGQDVLRRLVAGADILIQNLSPGAMDRFGLGYAALEKINPRLIMASGTGFGSFGPYAGEPAMDLTVQARTAIMSTTGDMDGEPFRTGPSVVDFMAGSHLFGGVMTALYQRERTGRGQHVEVALQDAILPSLSSNIAGMLNSKGAMPERTGNRHGGLAVVPYNAYLASDGWVTVLCPTQAHWERLCLLMGDPDARHARFANMDLRCVNVDEVDAIVGKWTITHTKSEIAAILAEARIPNAPVLSLQEVVDDPHVAERGVLRRMKDDEGEWLTLGSPLFLSDSPLVEPERARGLGADTDDILGNELQMTQDQISSLRSRSVI